MQLEPVLERVVRLRHRRDGHEARLPGTDFRIKSQSLKYKLSCIF